MQALINNIQAGVVVFKHDRSIEAINAAALRFLEEPSKDADTPPTRRPLNGWTILREDGRAMSPHDMPFERVLATGRTVRDVLFGLQTMSGREPRWALCNAFSDNEELGGWRHVVQTLVDITSLQRPAGSKALQAQLAQSQKMRALGTLEGGVAHDFNNILNPILCNADLARQDLAPDASAQQSLHEISTAALRGRELVRQIRRHSCTGTGQWVWHGPSHPVTDF